MKKYSGLTLIEVLIASIILFMSLGLVAVIFQQNISTQLQSSRYIKKLADYPSVQAQLRFELESGKRKGDIERQGLLYSWKAERLATGQELVSFSPETGNREGNPGMLVLYLVTISTGFGTDIEVKQAVWQNSVD